MRGWRREHLAHQPLTELVRGVVEGEAAHHRAGELREDAEERLAAGGRAGAGGCGRVVSGGGDAERVQEVRRRTPPQRGHLRDRLLKRLREKFQFELKVGRNGKVWVSGRMSDTIFIFSAFERCVQTFGDRSEIDRLLSAL